MSPLGASPTATGTNFAVWSQHAASIEVALFDVAGAAEIGRIGLERGDDDVHRGFGAGVLEGARYGLRADGDYAPDAGLWFDPAKLLIDPYALHLDRPFAYDPRLALPRDLATDTADLLPKCIVTALPPPPLLQPPCFAAGGLIYELAVRSFTMRHPDVPAAQRGTIAALAHPAVIAHLRKIGVSAVELMPIVAWIDERHLPPLGLHNGWGYNPVSFMALDPRLAPAGLAELRATVAALHAAGIGVILDLVFNHSGESDARGPTLCFRGLDARAYYRHAGSALVNDTGCGNTIACDHAVVHDLILDSLRYFVRNAGIDGFRFDLAPILGRSATGFDPQARLLRRLAEDPLLADRLMIAEPWDIGPGGYQLGQFPANFLEWNDRSRDDMRRYWRGDAGATGALATRLAGSSDVFGGAPIMRPATTRTVNFLAAHDGFALADLVAHKHKHNAANGEHNRDGHDENLSWNNGTEGETADPAIIAARRRDLFALLATLFASRGAIMLTAGDEFGRSQRGNNNAYAQDNDLTWLDWVGRDIGLEDHVAALATVRAAAPVLSDPQLLTAADVSWYAASGGPVDWPAPASDALLMLLHRPGTRRVAVLFNRSAEAVTFALPPGQWSIAGTDSGAAHDLGPRAVAIAIE